MDSLLNISRKLESVPLFLLEFQFQQDQTTIAAPTGCKFLHFTW